MSTKQHALKVFLCHAQGDENTVRGLYARLLQDGVDAWLSSENLVPGQDREFEIADAVRKSDAVIVCLSSQFNQPGSQQREARLALDTAMEQPEGEIFIIPARLDECDIPQSLKRFQAVDLFSSTGYDKLMRALKLDAERKNAALQQSKQKPVEKKKVPAPVKDEPKEAPAPLAPLIDGLNRLRFLLDIKYLSILIAALVLLFGNNIYAQVTGHSIFEKPPTPTSTATVAFTPTSIPTDTETPIPTSTDTATPTFTPVPATDTVMPTFTVVPPVALGKDWLSGCISTLWRPYPVSVTATEKGDGCWKEPLHVFFAENGDLDFLAQRRNAPAEIYGLFAPLPERGTVTVTVRLRELNNVDLWMGVFAEADVRSDGLLMIIPAGDVRKRVFVQKDPSNYETLADSRLFIQEHGFSISFRFDENSAKSIVNPSAFFTNAVPILSSQKWFFLGYRGLRGSYRVDGTFLNFELK